jgi:hypothetical protein
MERGRDGHHDQVGSLRRQERGYLGIAPSRPPRGRAVDDVGRRVHDAYQLDALERI